VVKRNQGVCITVTYCKGNTLICSIAKVHNIFYYYWNKEYPQFTPAYSVLSIFLSSSHYIISIHVFQLRIRRKRLSSFPPNLSDKSLYYSLDLLKSSHTNSAFILLLYLTFLFVLRVDLCSFFLFTVKEIWKTKWCCLFSCDKRRAKDVMLSTCLSSMVL